MPTSASALDPAGFRFAPDDTLSRFDPADTGPFDSEDAARDATKEEAERLARRQLILEAHGVYGVLVIFQGMDASGKDEAIHHVMAAVDPESGSARSFASMNEEEAQHDYLWRTMRALPARGKLAVFNRSYYEQVVGERVSPELMEAQSLPPEIVEAARDGSLWAQRYRQIRDVEHYLTENGIRVVKLFLHVSNEEQRRRLLERTERPEKRWDFSRADVEKRDDWDAFQEAYEAALRATSTEFAPWYVVPADHKWYARAVAAAIVSDTLGRLHHDQFPEPDDDLRDLLDWARDQLQAGE
jgi:PPK2 family polyphosphate:nucleotide phosphotransferase